MTPPQSPVKGPEIITFYSYKGGTGRSMALANVAFILAGNDFRVLVIDWDLEAPGLHRYFHPFLKDKELRTSEGIIDFVVDYATNAASSHGKAEDWYVPFGNILRYASSLDFAFRGRGGIDFVPAGRQGLEYAVKVNSFDWHHFYEELDGGVFLEFSKKSMRGYDFVLIDSRTGVSDTSGICTVQMPDKLVVCFTPNSQSIEGAAAVAESAYHQRIKPDGTPGLRILPVLTRVERGEQERIQMAKDLARVRFDELLGYMETAARDEYWSRVAVPHEPYYAFEEVLAVFAEKPDQEASILGIMKTLAEYVAGRKLQVPAIDEVVREAVMDRFARRMKRKVIRTLTTKGGAVTDLGFSADGTRAISGYQDGTAVIWDVEAGRVRQELTVQRTRKTAVAISADGRKAAVGSRGLVVWDEAMVRQTMPGAFEDITALSLSGDGALVLTCSEKRVELWDLSAAQRVRTFRGHKDWVRTVALSGNGQRAVSAGDDRMAVVWDVQTGDELRRFEGHKDWIWSAAISHNGLVAITGSDDGSAIVWDLVKWEARHTWRRHTGPVTAVSLNRDGTRALTGGKDGRIFFWDVESGEPLRVLDGHKGAVVAVSLSAGGRRAISGGVDGNVLLWDPEAADMVESTAAVVEVEMKPLNVPPTRVPAPEPISGPEVKAKYRAFVSYADADNDPYLSKFIDDLGKQLSLSTGEAELFVDRESIRPGERWSDSIHQGLEASRCLLAVCSPAYFRSEVDGVAFAAFAEDRDRLIVPVNWVPSTDIPHAVRQFQYMDRTLPEVYRQEGLRYLMRRKKFTEEYQRVLHILATRLADTGDSAMSPIRPLEQVSNAFLSEPEEAGFIVNFGSIAPDAYGNPMHWTPFGIKSLQEICQDLAAKMGVGYREVKISQSSVERWIREGSPTVAIFEQRSIEAPYLLKLLDESGWQQAVVVRNSEKELTEAIGRAITKIRLKMIAVGNSEASSEPLPQIQQEGKS